MNNRPVRLRVGGIAGSVGRTGFSHKALNPPGSIPGLPLEMATDEKKARRPMHLHVSLSTALLALGMLLGVVALGLLGYHFWTTWDAPAKPAPTVKESKNQFDLWHNEKVQRLPVVPAARVAYVPALRGTVVTDVIVPPPRLSLAEPPDWTAQAADWDSETMLMPEVKHEGATEEWSPIAETAAAGQSYDMSESGEQAVMDAFAVHDETRDVLAVAEEDFRTRFDALLWGICGGDPEMYRRALSSADHTQAFTADFTGELNALLDEERVLA